MKRFLLLLLIALVLPALSGLELLEPFRGNVPDKAKTEKASKEKKSRKKGKEKAVAETEPEVPLRAKTGLWQCSGKQFALLFPKHFVPENNENSILEYKGNSADGLTFLGLPVIRARVNAESGKVSSIFLYLYSKEDGGNADFKQFMKQLGKTLVELKKATASPLVQLPSYQSRNEMIRGRVCHLSQVRNGMSLLLADVLKHNHQSMDLLIAVSAEKQMKTAVGKYIVITLYPLNRAPRSMVQWADAPKKENRENSGENSGKAGKIAVHRDFDGTISLALPPPVLKKQIDDFGFYTVLAREYSAVWPKRSFVKKMAEPAPPLLAAKYAANSRGSCEEILKKILKDTSGTTETATDFLTSPGMSRQLRLQWMMLPACFDLDKEQGVKRMLSEYNNTIKKKKERLKAQNFIVGKTVMYSALFAKLDPKNYSTACENNRTGYRNFIKTVTRSIQEGSPLLWVTICFPGKNDASPKPLFETRLIIGVNEKDEQLIYVNGIGDERKKLPFKDGWPITAKLYRVVRYAAESGRK